MKLEHIAVSSGSACTSATMEPSYVLRALGLNNNLAKASIRVGFGRFTTEEDVRFAASEIIKSSTINFVKIRSFLSMPDDEIQLINQVKQSDQGAFHQLFEKYYPILFRFVVYRVKDQDLAEDIVQESFLRVWNIRTTLDPEKSFFSLMAKIGTNLCYDHFRYQEVRIRHKDTIPKPKPSHYSNPEMAHDFWFYRKK